MECHGQTGMMPAACISASCYLKAEMAESYMDSFQEVHLGLLQCGMVHPGTCLSLETIWERSHKILFGTHSLGTCIRL